MGNARASRNAVPRWQRLWLDGALWLLALSGTAWLVFHYGRGEDGLPGPMEPWLMRAHGFGAFAGLIAIGMFLASHAPTGMRRGERRTLGLAMLAALLFAVGSAFALYYFAPDPWRATISWTHAGVSVVWMALLFAHRRR